MICDNCGAHIPQGAQVFQIINGETLRSMAVCQTCVLQRYGGGGAASTASPPKPSSQPEPAAEPSPTFPCGGCGQMIEWQLSCPHCHYTAWWVAFGGLILALGCTVGGVFLMLFKVQDGRLPDLTWHFWVGLGAVVVGFIASLVMLAATLKVLLDVIGIVRAGVLSRLIRLLVILAIVGSLPVLYFWEVARQATQERELAKQAAAALPEFTFAHFVEQLPHLASDPKNTEKFGPPFFAITHKGHSSGSSAKEARWIQVPESTNRLADATTLLYIHTKSTTGKATSQQSKPVSPPPGKEASPLNTKGNPLDESSELAVGESKYTMTVCFIDRGNPRRRRIVELHEVYTTGTTKQMSYHGLLEKAYAEVRGD